MRLTTRAAAIREALNENAALLETSTDLKAYRDEVLANLKELQAKLGPSPAEAPKEEEKPTEKKPEPKPEPKQDPKPEASKPVVAPVSAGTPAEEGRDRTTTAMELAELEREQRELERDQAALDKEQKALEEAHARHSQALEDTAAKAIIGQGAAPGKIEDELAAAIVAL